MISSRCVGVVSFRSLLLRSDIHAAAWLERQESLYCARSCWLYDLYRLSVIKTMRRYRKFGRKPDFNKVAMLIFCFIYVRGYPT